MALRIHTISRWLIAICLVMTAVLGYVNAVLLDEDTFAERLSLALDDPEVRSGSVIKRIAEAHDATIEVESKLGEGSTFTLRWPVSPVNLTDDSDLLEPAPSLRSA